jgi:hypothetical protein
VIRRDRTSTAPKLEAGHREVVIEAEDVGALRHRDNGETHCVRVRNRSREPLEPLTTGKVIV